MSYQERIYGQCGFCPERNQTVHSVNMSSDFYVFNRPYYDLTGSTKVVDVLRGDATNGYTTFSGFKVA